MLRIQAMPTFSLIKFISIAFLITCCILFSIASFASSNNIASCTTIGVIGEFNQPTKGYSRYFGQETLLGTKVASNAIKDSQCFKIKPIETNNQLSNISFLIEKAAHQGIHFFIGLGTSEQALLAIPMLERTNSFLLSPTASDEKIIKNARIVTFFPSNKEITEATAKKMIQIGMNRVVIIYTENHYYSSETEKHFVAAFKDMGGTIPLIINERAGNLTLTPYKQALLEEKMTPVFLPDCDLDAAKIILELKELGSGSTIIGADSWSTYSSSVEDYLKNTDKPFIVNIMIPKITASLFHKKIERPFNHFFNQKNEKSPTDMTLFSYDAVFAINKATNFCQNKNLNLDICLSKYGKEAFGNPEELKGILIFKTVIVKNKIHEK